MEGQAQAQAQRAQAQAQLAKVSPQVTQVRAHRGGRARRAAVTRVRRCTRLWKPVNRTRQAGDHPRGEGRRSHGADRPSHVTRQQEQAHHSARYTRLFDLCTLRLYRPCALCHCAVCTDASFVYELKMYFVLREIYLHESSNVLFVKRVQARRVSLKVGETRSCHWSASGVWGSRSV